MTKKYEANWEALNSAPVPAWFNEAKLGLYIFWGPYSVPAYHPGSGYAEWFGNSDYGKEFIMKNYGENFIYEDFADMWKGELWDPEKWVDFFVQSGAKYIIVVAKYHDGFCLFPTQCDNRTVNRDKWNSIDRGPKRDILGELFTAGKKRGLKMGIYLSIYEWWHPLWVNRENRERYVNEVLHPQFKQVITQYEPCFVFMDGDWEADDETFKSRELVAWLLNESPVKDFVAFNDRWGQSRGVNGMIFNMEFGGGEGCIGHAWQEDRSICPTYGYNRNLDITRYETPEQIIAMLAKCASKGGNLILGVGPSADGLIPVIYQDRLLQLGKWLEINGEAIYGTQCWNTTCQGEELLYTKKDDDLYAISLKWPGKELALHDIKKISDFKITMLGCGQILNWRLENDGLHINVPQLTIDQLPCQYAWVIKITGAAIV